MRSDFTIKNFRVFNSDGFFFDIKPITILTGCNNSGKSSLTKACELFADWIKSISPRIKRDGILGDLFKQPLRLNLDYLKLGRLDSVLNDHNNGITFQFSYNDFSFGTITVLYTFVKKNIDIANNAWLSALQIIDEKGNILLDATYDKCCINLRPLKAWTCDISNYRLNGRGILNPYNSSNEDGRECELYNLLKEENIKQQTILSEHLKNRYGKFYETKIPRDDYNSVVKYHYFTFTNEAKPLFIYEQLESLDKIPKEELFNHIVEISKSKHISTIHENINPELLLEKLKIITDDYSQSDYQNFSDYLGSMENSSSLVANSWILQTGWLLQDLYDYKTDVDCSSCFDTIGRLLLGAKYKDEIHSVKYFMEFVVIPFFKKAIIPEDFIHFSYIGTTQIAMNRIFPINASGGTFSSLLNEYITATSSKSHKNLKPGFFINRWIKHFHIGSSVKFKLTDEGSGVSVIIKNHNNKSFTNLCDMGHGIAQLLSILISIETTIFKSQYLIKEDNSTIAIEEPEAHLHPKYQSMLSSVFADAYLNYNVHFMIETHSEYLIRAFQKCVAYGQKNNKFGLSKDDISIYYFNEPRKDFRLLDEPQIKKIKIDNDGCLTNTFGPGFFDEALNLSTDLLRIKLERNAR